MESKQPQFSLLSLWLWLFHFHPVIVKNNANKKRKMKDNAKREGKDKQGNQETLEG